MNCNCPEGLLEKVQLALEVHRLAREDDEELDIYGAEVAGLMAAILEGKENQVELDSELDHHEMLLETLKANFAPTHHIWKHLVLKEDEDS